MMQAQLAQRVLTISMDTPSYREGRPSMRPKRPEALEAASAMSTMLTPDRLRVLLQLIVGQVRLQSDDCTDTRAECWRH